jgi:hypothetical protein
VHGTNGRLAPKPKRIPVSAISESICNYDPAIIRHLGAPYGSAFWRVPGTDEFKPERLEASGE